MDTFSALSDPTRRSILEMLAKEGRLSASEIGAQFPISPPAVSQHLKVLRQANLVMVEKQAQQRIYRINPDAMLELEDWARQLRELWGRRFDALERVLEVEKRKQNDNRTETSDDD
jgi:DNA-binding transcriptional ArsR family regulator